MKDQISGKSFFFLLDLKSILMVLFQLPRRMIYELLLCGRAVIQLIFFQPK